jgi:tRNA(fMet)-specific endonuclease VapC
MGGSYLLDTNVVVAFFAGDAIVHARFYVADEPFLSSTVVGELYFGAYKSERVAANVERIDTLVANTTQLACDVETARHYGIIRESLRKKGCPIPENDIWIAASAIQHGLTLATRDQHFENVEGLLRESW